MCVGLIYWGISFPAVYFLTPTQLVFLLKTLPKAVQTYTHNISFDAEFYSDSEFLFKILIPPTNLEKIILLKICVGGFKKIFSQRIKN